ncbi:MAG: hypothetical protein QXI19_13885 [Candidatus Caldarchaeum sp.]
MKVGETSYYAKRYKTVHMPEALFKAIEAYVEKSKDADSAMSVVRSAALLKIHQYMYLLKKGGE